MVPCFEGHMKMLAAFIQKEDLDGKISTHFHPHRGFPKKMRKSCHLEKKQKLLENLKYRGRFKKIFMPWYIEESATFFRKKGQRAFHHPGDFSKKLKNHEGFRQQKFGKKQTNTTMLSVPATV